MGIVFVLSIFLVLQNTIDGSNFETGKREPKERNKLNCICGNLFIRMYQFCCKNPLKCKPRPPPNTNFTNARRKKREIVTESITTLQPTQTTANVGKMAQNIMMDGKKKYFLVFFKNKADGKRKHIQLAINNFFLLYTHFIPVSLKFE